MTSRYGHSPAEGGCCRLGSIRQLCQDLCWGAEAQCGPQQGGSLRAARHCTPVPALRVCRRLLREALGCALPRPGVKGRPHPASGRSCVGMPQTRGLKSPLVGGTWAPGRELLQEGGLWQSQAGARLDSAGGRHWDQGLAESAKCLPSPHLLSLVPGGRWCHQPSLFGRGQELGLPRQCCLWGRWSGELETVVLGPWVPLPPPFPGGSARPGTLCFPVHSPRCWAACPPRRRRGISQPSPDRIKEKYTSKQIAAS